MIAASDPQEFVPSGRQQTLKHPGPNGVPPQKNLGQTEDLLLDKFEKVSIKEKKDSEWWILRKTPLFESAASWCYGTKDSSCTKVSVNQDCKNDKSYSYQSCDHSQKTSKRISESFSKFSLKHESLAHGGPSYEGSFAKSHVSFMEDELYVKGHTAVWSRGLNNCDNLDNGRKTICAYTSLLPIKHAAWCTFHCEHPRYETDAFPFSNKEEETKGVPVPAICIINAHNIHVFTQKGEDFVTAIPFQISKMWNTKYGIFLERENEGHNSTTYFENRASLYSLAFPFDEVCPVAINVGTHIQVLNNNSFKLVYTSENPSICMIYDTQTRQHSVYVIRKVTINEKVEFANRMNSTFPSATSLSNRLKSRLSMWDCGKNSNYLSVPSPINSRPGSVASFYNQMHHSKSHSSMATISRCQSPATSSIGSPWLQRASRLNTSIPSGPSYCAPNNCSFFDCSKLMSYLHTNPLICLDHLWTDPNLTQDDNMSSATSKVFLCDDLTHQWYLCYILPVKCQLCLVQIDFTDPSNIRFGMVNSLSVKDAVPIPMCHMLAVLEHNGNVSLYSGLTLVGKLHIGGTLVQHTPSPYVRRNLAQFNSPFPRRSSLLPHCKQLDPKFDDHLLSPVLPETTNVSNILQLNFQHESNLPKAVLNGLRDPIENRITLRYSDGTYYRITLPPLTAHPLIENCVMALKQCLNRDTISVVLTRWYATRNAPGAQDMNLEQEWNAFETLLLEFLGYEQDFGNTEDCPVTPCSNPKRQKHSSAGTDEDWLYLSNSDYATKLDKCLKHTLLLKCNSNPPKSHTRTLQINVNSLLFPFIRLILYCLHLLYEDLKLNVLRSDDLKLLAIFLNKIASDLGMVEYVVHYWKDFPDCFSLNSNGYIAPNELKQVHEYPFIGETPANIMQFLCHLMQKGEVAPYPFVNHVNNKSKDIVQICGIIFKELGHKPANLLKLIEPNITSNGSPVLQEEPSELSPPEQTLLLMTSKKMTVRDLDTLPPAIYLLIYSTLWKCRDNPPSDLPSDAYYLLWRDDLAVQAHKFHKEKPETTLEKIGMYTTHELPGIVLTSKPVESEQQDGMDDIENPLTKLRFPDDMRVAEARKMLQSSKPVPIVLVQRPDVSDHDFIEEEEKHLFAICTRTMALSTGRGMFTLRTSAPVVTEPLQTPPLCLTGKAPPRGTTVELNHIDTPSNMNLWPLFHNGVANGLRINPDAHNVDNTWIVFNKPKGSMEQQMEHAGFLMALGLNGHLKNLDALNTYDYLIKLHEMTSIGILLGMSAAFRGTSDLGMTKTLSIHVEAMLPPTSMELDVHQNVQVAALLGIGLVYQGTSHRHIIEVLLSEIGRPPGPEMENSVDRESYSLAAGLSLGLVTLKQGSCSLGLSDLNISDRLHYYMVGGNRRPLTGAQKDKYKVPSFQIREGSSINLDVTAPGATIALGLMYLGTGNKAVADWMAPPETQYLLDFVRPDFLMFRILARALILWDDIVPSKEWVEGQVPGTIRPYCMLKPSPNLDIDFEAMNQAYCNIVTGACFALGLKYAGSADENAFQTLLHFCRMFTNLTIKSIAELAGKPTVETCLNVLLLSSAMVMAGTGNLEIMRFVRLLRRRVGVASSSVVTYGSHLAMHMALGLLFLGGGRYTLSNSPGNIAALICAFYPKFPTHSNDNRYHLQAFRHLYVLAVEPRLIIPKDVHSGKCCYASLSVVKLDGTKSFVKAPGIIPDLSMLKEVAIEDERYWPVVFKRSQNWNSLITILSTNGFVEVKQRAGCLSYIADKLGYHSQLAKTLTQSETVPWNPSSSSILSFTHDQAIKYFCDHFLSTDKLSPQELKLTRMLTKATYDAVVKDKLVVIPVISFLLKVVRDMRLLPNALNFWQVKLLFAQIISTPLACNLIQPEVMLAIKQQMLEVLEDWEPGLAPALEAYTRGADLAFDKETLNRLAMYVIFYDIPFRESAEGDPLEVMLKLQDKYSVSTLEKIMRLRM
ncbi:anaphase-promoting complex subunit 1 [Tribolium castaneum]|uniref:Shattered n=1 Tax=Tribolium castaneum TaxID=7070 RepID=D6W9Y0_TRICA|nr:PREDICTED: anaphase-promoting complex subunit 1 [Tribolium castaneum]EEZ99272.2 shattered [Tribolium castaneum]|eukprot:XP_008201205.1 PREDICTED: anaphase-promoting complex subunit 1 [Tribolium castaneum]